MNLQKKTPNGTLRAFYTLDRENFPGFNIDVYIRKDSVRRPVCDVLYDPEVGKICVIVYSKTGKETKRIYIEE